MSGLDWALLVVTAAGGDLRVRRGVRARGVRHARPARRRGHRRLGRAAGAGQFLAERDGVVRGARAGGGARLDRADCSGRCSAPRLRRQDFLATGEGSLDALGGAVLAAASVLIVAWVLGVAVSGARIPSVTSAVRGSQVLAKVDEVLPNSADRALQSFNDVVNTDLFPRFLDPFVPERIRETQPPDSGIARQQSVRDAYSRIAKVTGVANCSRGLGGQRVRLRAAARDDERARRRRRQLAAGRGEREEVRRQGRACSTRRSTSRCCTCRR